MHIVIVIVLALAHHAHRNRHPARSRRIQNAGKVMDSATPLRYAQNDKGSFS
jgi:fumarate reductase subunit D